MNSLINEFCEACEEGNLELVKKLSKNKQLNINKKDNNGTGLQESLNT